MLSVMNKLDLVTVMQELREGLVKAFYSDLGIDKDEIFISDGAKCDVIRLQVPPRCIGLLKLITFRLSQI